MAANVSRKVDPLQRALRLRVLTKVQGRELEVVVTVVHGRALAQRGVDLLPDLLIVHLVTVQPPEIAIDLEAILCLVAPREKALMKVPLTERPPRGFAMASLPAVKQTEHLAKRS